MNRILAALVLSTAAIGAAQAGEVGYVDNPGAKVQSSQPSLSRAQVQNALNADRANVDAFQGQLNPSRTDVRTGTENRTQAAHQNQFAKAVNPAGGAFVNG
ncbi:hypothetical protein FXN63_25330 [Pigmentiphaga aceris]|uniref:DUF4148 domain-containing protein n=1 Tax=Pigmentiphaga aceris TaxID=1940612 RepID=A0A5C0B715_9BURK|nr:hypothetical protein [Pigmentiphaga aceris]QEI08801.1 hypothetical protein FXN63_25330 [Pigmentiphaga aceris]